MTKCSSQAFVTSLIMTLHSIMHLLMITNCIFMDPLSLDVMSAVILTLRKGSYCNTCMLDFNPGFNMRQGLMTLMEISGMVWKLFTVQHIPINGK